MALVHDTQPTCTPFRININGIESQKDQSGLNKIHKLDNAFTSLNKVWLTFIIRLIMSLSLDPSSLAVSFSYQGNIYEEISIR